MEIQKVITKSIYDAHGSEITEGTHVVVQCGNKDIIATFEGYTDRGALKFTSFLGKKNLNLMPRTIDKIYPFEDIEKGE